MHQFPENVLICNTYFFIKILFKILKIYFLNISLYHLIISKTISIIHIYSGFQRRRRSFIPEKPTTQKIQWAAEIYKSMHTHTHPNTLLP